MCESEHAGVEGSVRIDAASPIAMSRCVCNPRY